MNWKRGWPLLAACGLAASLMWTGCFHGSEVAGVAGAGAADAPLITAADLVPSVPLEMAQIQKAADRQAAVEASLAAIPTVVGTAAGLYRGTPVVIVLTQAPTPGIRAQIAAADAVQFVVGEVQASATYCGTSTSRADLCAAGTLGAIVTDGVRNYWLSNWHVFARTQAAVGDIVDAPGRLDAGCGTSPAVGALSRFVPVHFDGTSNTVDCAIAKITIGAVSPIEAAGSSSFLPTSRIATAAIGLAVKKVGRTTKLTTGSVIGVNATTAVTYTGIGTARFVGCVLMTPMAQPGDSGSLICTRSTNDPVALLFASSSSVTVGCPIGSVYQQLGVRIPG